MAKGNPKKEANERTKVVVRHLPPSLSRSELFTHFDHLFSDRYNWVSFRPGKSSRNSQNQRHSRAYIDFKSPGDVMEFEQFFNGHRFVNEKGAQCFAIVEYAPSQRVPKPCAKDSREGTFLRDPHYLEFLKLIAKPVEGVHSSEFRFERKEAEEADGSKDSIVVTPLMDFVRKKRAAETGIQYSSKVRPKKPSRKDKALVNEALGLEAKPSSSSQNEGSQTKSSPRVRGSAKRLNKTADSEKKNKERKQKTSLNQGREASERMIKHVLLSRESRLKKPLTTVYPQDIDHPGLAGDEKNRNPQMELGSTNCTPPRTPSLVVGGSDQRRNASDDQFMKKNKAEKSSRHRRKMDRPTHGMENPSLRSDQQHAKKECDESRQLPAEAAKTTKSDASSRKAKAKPSRKGVATGNPDSEKQVWIPKATAAS